MYTSHTVMYVCTSYTYIPYIVNHLRWKSFVVEEMDCNSLENIGGSIIVFYDQTLLHKGIIANSLESFSFTDPTPSISNDLQYTVYTYRILSFGILSPNEALVSH